eukprot:Tbor_TRINITY_DN5618_c1_g4::TRINITY_DN5618_c1_g4_i1::g.8467::m.8467
MQHEEVRIIIIVASLVFLYIIMNSFYIHHEVYDKAHSCMKCYGTSDRGDIFHRSYVIECLNRSPGSEVIGSNNHDSSGIDNGGKHRFLKSTSLAESGGEGTDTHHPGEQGWVYNLERNPSETSNTRYDPVEDIKYKGTNQYARSPVPKGSWEVRIGPNKSVRMDDVVFAYDVWFEENQVFQYLSWMGVYVQQDPMDAFAIQDMIWRVKPDLIIEIGTNTGGGAIFYSTFMKVYNPKGKIVTLDIKDISNWNTKNNNRCVGCLLATEHPWWNDGMITFIKGKVTNKDVQARIQREFVDKAKVVMVIEDASHRYRGTLHNIEAAYKWITPGSYMLVQDTKMDRFVGGLGKQKRNLKIGPMGAVDKFMEKHSDKFVIDRRFEYLLYSQHHRGFLRRKEDSSDSPAA